MAGDPAIVKVITAATKLFSDGMGINVFVDRSEDDPIREEERPAMAVRCVQLEFTPAPGQSEMLHECVFDFDFYEENLTVGGISANLSRMIAQANGLIAADRTLGGMLQQFELRSATAELDATPDLGCAILTAEISFLTPRHDFTTILGASGFF